MDIFSIKNQNQIFKLNEKTYERATDRKEPYYQTVKGEKKYYALCPECKNPIIIVNLYVKKTVDSEKNKLYYTEDITEVI